MCSDAQNMFSTSDIYDMLLNLPHSYDERAPADKLGKALTRAVSRGRTGCWESLACLPAWQRSETAGSAREVKAEHDSGTEEWIFNQPHAAAPFEYLMALFFDDYLPIMVSCQRLKGKALVAIVWAQHRFGVLQGWTLLSVCQLAAFLLPHRILSVSAAPRPSLAPPFPAGAIKAEKSKVTEREFVPHRPNEWTASWSHTLIYCSTWAKMDYETARFIERKREREGSHMTSEYCDVIKMPCSLHVFYPLCISV